MNLNHSRSFLCSCNVACVFFVNSSSRSQKPLLSESREESSLINAIVKSLRRKRFCRYYDCESQFQWKLRQSCECSCTQCKGLDFTYVNCYSQTEKKPVLNYKVHTCYPVSLLVTPVLSPDTYRRILAVVLAHSFNIFHHPTAPSTSVSQNAK